MKKLMKYLSNKIDGLKFLREEMKGNYHRVNILQNFIRQGKAELQ